MIGTTMSPAATIGLIATCILAGGVAVPVLGRVMAKMGLRVGPAVSSTIAIYEENNAALKESNEIHQQKISELRTDLDTANKVISQQDQRLQAQAARMGMLEEMVLQVRGIDELHELISHVEGRILDKVSDEHSHIAGLVAANGTAIEANGQKLATAARTLASIDRKIPEAR